MKKDILILSARQNSKANTELSAEIKKAGYVPRVLNPAQLQPYISNHLNRDLMYDSFGNEYKRVFSQDLFAVIPRMAGKLSYTSYVLEQLNNNIGIYSPQTAEAIRIASNKMATLQKCSSAGVKVPKTLFATEKIDIDFLAEKLGLPFVCKYPTGSQGNGVALIESKKSGTSVIQALLKKTDSLIFQEFVGKGKTDIRAIVVGNRVVAAEMRKTSKRNEFRSNLSIAGGQAVPYTPDAETEAFCVQASKGVGLDISGVDIMFDANNEPTLIEVNTNFGWKVADVTGINIAKYIVEYTILKAQNYAPKQIQSPVSVFEDSKYLQKVFDKSKGRTIRYTDRNQKQQSIEIASPEDLYKIIEQTVQFS